MLQKNFSDRSIEYCLFNHITYNVSGKVIISSVIFIYFRGKNLNLTRFCVYVFLKIFYYFFSKWFTFIFLRLYTTFIFEKMNHFSGMKKYAKRTIYRQFISFSLSSPSVQISGVVVSGNFGTAPIFLVYLAKVGSRSSTSGSFSQQLVKVSRIRAQTHRDCVI